jgi:hypothetical protein
MKPTPENQYVFSMNMYLAGIARQIHIIILRKDRGAWHKNRSLPDVPAG